MTCQSIFATAATADRTDADVGVIWWAMGVDGYALAILDYQLSETSAINAGWVEAYFKQSAELVAKHNPAERACALRVEHPGLISLIERADSAFRDTRASRSVDRASYDIEPITGNESAKWPATFDERAYSIRPLVDSGKVIKPARGVRRFPWHAVNENHLAAQLGRHKAGEPASELVGAFTLGVLLGTTPKTKSLPDFFDDPPAGPADDDPFSAGFIAGARPR